MRQLWRGEEGEKDWYFVAEQPAPAPHLAHPEGCAALRSVLVTVPRGEEGDLALPLMLRVGHSIFTRFDNLLVRVHFIIVMIRWTGLAPWEFEFPFPVALHLPS